jgi:hypothetical protein
MVTEAQRRARIRYRKTPGGIEATAKARKRHRASQRYQETTARYQREYESRQEVRERRKKRNQSEAAKQYFREYARGPGRIRSVLRSRLCSAVRNGSKDGSAVRDLGCTIPEFRTYIEALWAPGMTWENWGKGPGTWQIDHRRPLASFDLTKREDVLVACHFLNLQPLWHEEHARKSGHDRVLIRRVKRGR